MGIKMILKVIALVGGNIWDSKNKKNEEKQCIILFFRGRTIVFIYYLQKQKRSSKTVNLRVGEESKSMGK